MSLTGHAVFVSGNFIGSVFVHLQHAGRERWRVGGRKVFWFNVGRLNHRLVNIEDEKRESRVEWEGNVACRPKQPEAFEISSSPKLFLLFSSDALLIDCSCLFAPFSRVFFPQFTQYFRCRFISVPLVAPVSCPAARCDASHLWSRTRGGHRLVTRR